MDLGSLADVDSPEVVKEALRTFRRRTLRSMIWAVAVVALLAIPVLGRVTDRELSDRIASAEGAAPGAVYQSRGVTVVLMRVADLGKTTGIHVVVSAAEVEGDNEVWASVESPRVVSSDNTRPARLSENWFELVVPPDGRIGLRALVLPRCDPPPGSKERTFSGCIGVVDPHDLPERTFTIDLRAAGVPERFWR
jgi:hypothetical protein